MGTITKTTRIETGSYECRPLDERSWPDLEALFGKSGACYGCWCAYWRVPRKAFKARRNAENRAALHELACSGRTAGLIGYRDGVPEAWAAVGPRSDFPALDGTRWLYPVDGTEVWSVPCFYIPTRCRGRGWTGRLIAEAAAHAARNGASVLEAYPVDPKGRQLDPRSIYTGVLDTFLALGFEEVARRADHRPIVRVRLSPDGLA